MSAWTTILALLVVSCVVWGLRVKGISLTNDADCGIEEHTHNAGCYEYYEVCGIREGELDADGSIHTHNAECYSLRLSCGMDEHYHTIDCYEITDNETNGMPEQDDMEVPDYDELPENEPLENQSDFEELLQALLVEEELPLEEEVEVVAGPALYAPGPNPTTNGEYYRNLIQQHLDSGEEIHYGEFYVVTETGLRWADKINEYLVNANGEVEDLYSSVPGVFYEETQGDGKKAYYLRNAGWPNGRDLPDSGRYYVPANFRNNYNDRRYILYPDDGLTLVVFRTPEQTTYNGTGNYVYTLTDDGERGSIINQAVFRDIPDGWDGTSVVVARVNPGSNPGDFATFHFDKVSGNEDGDMSDYYGDRRYESFYTRILPANRNYTHSDIEITDGGFFNITTTRNFEDNTYNKVFTHYDSYVSDIRECIIHREGKSDIRYGSECYERLSNDATQNEITSAFYCSGRSQYHYDAADVTSADFRIALSLAPVKSVIEKYDADDQLISRETVDFRDETGDYSYTVQWLDVTMNRQSVVDAINKCPNHSGMDFNLKYTEINHNFVLPRIDSLKLRKEVEGSDITPSDFKFQLWDANYSPERIIADDVSVDADGNILFPEQAFAVPGTYRYKIREKIDEDAIELEKNVFYKDLVKYDGREIDVKVEIKLMPSMVAVVNGYEDPELVVETTYSIDGVELDMDNPEDREKIIFRNESIDYKEKSLDVRKVWKDSDDHSGDRITFRIAKTKNGTETQYYEQHGNTVFELNPGNGWHMQFEHLPMIAGDDTYSYTVLETDMEGYSPTYTTTETEDNISWTITNVKDADRELYFKKIWTDDEGNEIAAPDGVEQVHVKLRRQYQEKPITFKVFLQSADGGGGYTDVTEIEAYNGGKVEFQLRDRPNGPTQRLTVNTSLSRDCSCSITGDNKYVVDITGHSPELVLQYDTVTEDNLIFWNTGYVAGHPEREFTRGSAAGQWDNIGSGRGADDLHHAYRTYYSSSNPGGDGVASAFIQKYRIETWAGSRLNIVFDDDRIRPGEYYSFSARVGYKREFTQTDDGNPTGLPASEDPVSLALQLYSVDSGGTEHWDNIDVVNAGNPISGTFGWEELQNICFKIPEGRTNIKLVVNTIETDANNSTKRGRYADLYFDDVIIAPANYKVGVDQTGNLVGTREYLMNYSRTIPVAAMEWQEDTDAGANIYSFTIEKDSDWQKQLRVSEFGKVVDGKKKGEPELINRNYRYYIVEEFEHGEGDIINPENYKVFYDDMYVGYNTLDSPMIVNNQYHAYVLPNTGGIGAYRIRWLGLFILLAGIPPTLIYLVRKRGRPSG